MALEMNVESQMQAAKCQGSSLESLSSKAVCSRHKHSKRFCLKDIQDQFSALRALEKALGRRSSSHDTSNENSMPKPAKELIKEIAVLELEVVYLEQYLLSLYRRAFDQQTSSLSPSSNDEGLRSPPKSKPRLYLEAGGLDITSKLV